MASEQSPLMLEITRAKEMFKAYLDQPSPGEALTSEIFSSLDKSFCMAKNQHEASQRPPRPDGGIDTTMEPRMNTKNGYRRTMPKSSSQVKVVVNVDNGPIDDGYSWRKYGQKNIQYTKYPRCYYKCSHRNTRGCPAIKQMQQSSDDPSVLEVTYLRAHTCHERPELESDEPEPKKNHLDHHVQQQYEEPDSLSRFRNGLTVKTEVSGSELTSPSVSFPITPLSCLDLSALENCYMDLSALENCFSMSPCQTSNYPEGTSVQIEESNILATNTAANSPFMDMDDIDMDLLLNLRDFDDPNFPFL